MDKLKELHRQKRMLFPEMRRLQIKASQNLLDSDSKAKLDRIEALYDQNFNEIIQQEQKVIEERFGSEVLNEWNEFKIIEGSSFTNSSEVGKRYNILKEKLKEICILLEKVNEIEYPK